MNGVQNDAFEDSDHEDRVPISEAKVFETEDKHLLSKLYSKYAKFINGMIVFALVGGYHAYFIYCIIRYAREEISFWCERDDCSDLNEKPEDPPYWCDSLAILVIITGLSWLGVIYGYVVKPLAGKSIERSLKPVFRQGNLLLQKKVVRLALYFLVIGGILAFLIVNAVLDNGRYERYISMAGFFAFIAIGWIFSEHPGKVRWRQVTWGFTLQFFFALIVLKWDIGRQIVNCLSSKVESFLSYSDYGSEMVYGYLVTDKIYNPAAAAIGKNETDLIHMLEVLNRVGSTGSGMMFKILSLIYFLSFFVSMLYYLGILQSIVIKLGWLLSATVGTTAAESVNAAANIFLGQTEAPLLIKPFLSVMTKSEIHAVMTGGFATIAGTVLGAYIGIGIDAPALITASFMAAPTALAVSKLFYPETEQSRTTIKDIVVDKGDNVNVLDAAAKGASTAIMLILNIAASLIAFKSFIAFLDGAVAWFGMHAGADINFQVLLGYLFWPLAFLMGIEVDNCKEVARLIGMKLLVTEFPAFQDLGDIKKACGEDPTSAGCTLSDRSIEICTFALCGFANFASLGLQIGALGGLCPERKSVFAQVVLRAMIAGCWVSFLNACVVGALNP